MDKFWVGGCSSGGRVSAIVVGRVGGSIPTFYCSNVEVEFQFDKLEYTDGNMFFGQGTKSLTI